MSDLKPTLQTLLVRLVLSLAILLLAVPSEAGTVKNDTDCTAYIQYLGKHLPGTDIPAHGERCFCGFVDFPAFRLECNSNWRCPIPFMTSKTTVRLYMENGEPRCSRDHIHNTCSCSSKAHAGTSASIFSEFDWNGDGSLSRAEFRTTVESNFSDQIPEIFESLDQNGDGSVDDDEFRTAGEAP